MILLLAGVRVEAHFVRRTAVAGLTRRVREWSARSVELAG